MATRYEKSAANNTKTHCIHGHSLDDAYIVYHYYKGKTRRMRICKPCQLGRVTIQRAKRGKV